jgi:hypothetical protein
MRSTKKYSRKRRVYRKSLKGGSFSTSRWRRSASLTPPPPAYSITRTRTPSPNSPPVYNRGWSNSTNFQSQKYYPNTGWACDYNTKKPIGCYACDQPTQCTLSKQNRTPSPEIIDMIIEMLKKSDNWRIVDEKKQSTQLKGKLNINKQLYEGLAPNSDGPPNYNTDSDMDIVLNKIMIKLQSCAINNSIDFIFKEKSNNIIKFYLYSDKFIDNNNKFYRIYIKLAAKKGQMHIDKVRIEHTIAEKEGPPPIELLGNSRIRSVW